MEERWLHSMKLLDALGVPPSMLRELGIREPWSLLQRNVFTESKVEITIPDGYAILCLLPTIPPLVVGQVLRDNWVSNLLSISLDGEDAVIAGCSGYAGPTTRNLVRPVITLLNSWGGMLTVRVGRIRDIYDGPVAAIPACISIIFFLGSAGNLQ